MVLEGDPGDPPTVSGIHTVSTRSTKPAARRRELLVVDEYPNDDDDDDPLIGSEYPDEPSDPGKYVAAAAAETRYFELAHQNFCWEYGALTPAELIPIVVHSRRTFDNVLSIADLENADREELEFNAFLQGMFFTSGNIDRTYEMRQYRLGSTSATLALITDAKDGVPRWRVAAPLPVYAPQATAPEGIDRLRSGYLELPDTFGGSRLIKLLIDLREAEETAQPNRTHRSTRIFRSPKEWYRERFTLWLKEHDSTGRLTEGRIARFLRDRLLDASGGDVVAVSMIVGQELPLARSRLFYACPSEDRLQRLYYSTTAKILADAESAASVEPSSVKPLLAKSKFYIGNRINPTKDAVIAAVKHVKQDLKRLRKPSNEEELRDYLNTYTFFTTWAFQFATSWRGTATPYLPLSKIHQSLGTYVGADKDSGSGYRNRIGWLPLEMVAQVKFHTELMASLPYREKADPSWSCFYLDENFSPIEVRPSTTKPIMNRYLPLPANIHRRFMASELLELGPGLVEFECLWSGHWFRGEEPWAPMSTYNFEKHKRLLERFLFPFWRELGFRAIRPFSDIKL